MKGTGSYPDDWRAIATAAKAEAGWRCVRCHHPNRTFPKRLRGGHTIELARDFGCDDRCTHEPDEKKRILTVHHLDGDKGNCRWWNIPPLCQVCHLQIQAKVVMGQTYMHAHSPWMVPYVAGYYAFTVLGEDLSRDEVMARLPEIFHAGQPGVQPPDGWCPNHWRPCPWGCEMECYLEGAPWTEPERTR